MAAQRLAVKFFKQRRPLRFIVAEPQQIFQPQLVFLLFGQQSRLGNAYAFVAQRPQTVQPQRFMTGGIRQNIRIFAARGGQLIGHNFIKQAFYDTARRNASARVAGSGDKIIQHRHQSTVSRVQFFQLGFFGFGQAVFFILQKIGNIHILRTFGGRCRCFHTYFSPFSPFSSTAHSKSAAAWISFSSVTSTLE